MHPAFCMPVTAFRTTLKYQEQHLKVDGVLALMLEEDCSGNTGHIDLRNKDETQEWQSAGTLCPAQVWDVCQALQSASAQSGQT